jgi:hypothetical protein
MSNLCHIYDDRGLFYDHIASWRLRVQIPRTELKKFGITSISSMKPINDAVHVYHKYYSKNFIDWIKDTGGIYDIVDDHFNHDWENYYRNMCKLAPVITTSTKRMKDRIKEETGREAIVVQDSYDPSQYVARKPRYKNTKSICWFGSETNLIHLKEINIPCCGDLVTHAGLQPTAMLDVGELEKKGWKYIPWVSGIMPNIFKRHDIVIIPYGNSPKQYAKSPNRIVDSLRSGMIVVTNDTPVVDAYGLRDFCVINNNISEGVKSVWDDPTEALLKVEAGQDYIEQYLSPLSIAKQWAEAISQC